MHYDFIIAGSVVKAVDTHERLLLSVVFIGVFIARNKGDIAGANVLTRLRKCDYRGMLAIATFGRFKSQKSISPEETRAIARFIAPLPGSAAR